MAWGRQGVRGVVGGVVGRDKGVHGLVHDGALGAFGRGEQASHHASARTGDAGRLVQRFLRVACELERVDAGHRVERAVTERQVFHVALAQVSVRQPVVGDLEEAWADVQAAGDGAEIFGQHEGETGAAAHVEQAGARADARGVQDRLEQRLVVRLGQLRPGPRVGAPQAALDVRGGADRRDVLVEPEDIVWVVDRLDLLQTLDRAAVGASGFLVVTHEVNVSSVGQEWLDGGVGGAGPGDLVRVVGGVAPGGRDIDQPAGLAEREGRRLLVDPSDGAAKRQQLDLRDRRSKRGRAVEQDVYQPVGQVIGEAGLDVGAQAVGEQVVGDGLHEQEGHDRKVAGRRLQFAADPFQDGPAFLRVA